LSSAAGGRLGGIVLIVAVHDVATPTLPEVRWLLARLDDAGVAVRVLKVIPAGADAALDELARAEAAAGSEVVLHGWTHRADGAYRGSAGDRLRARLFAGGSAEFLSLPPGEMRVRLDAGCTWLERVGIPPRGFCPPAWLAGPGLPAAARAAGFRYLVTLRGLRDLAPPPGAPTRIDLPATGYMGAGAAQEALIRLGAAALFRPLAGLLHAPAIRIYLHPQGASASRACARVLRQVEQLARGHRSGTYAELLGA
jgi:predicted deacetylase